MLFLGYFFLEVGELLARFSLRFRNGVRPAFEHGDFDFGQFFPERLFVHYLEFFVDCGGLVVGHTRGDCRKVQPLLFLTQFLFLAEELHEREYEGDGYTHKQVRRTGICAHKSEHHRYGDGYDERECGEFGILYDVFAAERAEQRVHHRRERGRQIRLILNELLQVGERQAKHHYADYEYGDERTDGNGERGDDFALLRAGFGAHNLLSLDDAGDFEVGQIARYEGQIHSVYANHGRVDYGFGYARQRHENERRYDRATGKHRPVGGHFPIQPHPERYRADVQHRNAHPQSAYPVQAGVAFGESKLFFHTAPPHRPMTATAAAAASAVSSGTSAQPSL